MPIPRALRVPALPLLLALSALGGAPTPAAAAPEAKVPTKEALAAVEAKLLLPILRTAVKEDFRRQAWYVASRVLSADPKNGEAEGVLKQWKAVELQEGREPSKAWLAVRDAAFRKVGDAYAQYVREAQAAGGQATDTFAYVERALAYGSVAADAVAAMDSGGYVWDGTYGSVKKGALEAALGAYAESVAFPPEHDDAVLRHRCAWPDAKVVEFGRTRLVSALPPEDVWHTIGILAAEEAYFVKTFGSKAKEPAKDEDEHTDFVLVPDADLYGRLGDVLLPQASPQQRAEYDASSSWYMAWRRKVLLALVPPRDNPWVERDATILGQGVRPLVRRHIGAGASSWISGRGSWFLDGMTGAFEGFVPKGTDGGEVDPARCWRLAAAKELHDRAALAPWKELFEMDRAKADAFPKRDVAFEQGGAKRDAKKVDVPAAQATALVFAIWQLDGGKGAKKLASVLEELYKRDRLPDLDKALGLGAGKVVDATQHLLSAK